MKRVYEFMVLVAPDVDLTEEKKQKDFVAKLLADTVSITNLTSLGKKALAYTIRKQTEATYLVAELSADAVKVGDIEQKVKVNEKVLRYMLISKN